MKRTTSIIKFAAQLNEQVTKHRETIHDLRVYQINAMESRKDVLCIFQNGKGNLWKQTLSAEGEWSELASHGAIIL